MDTQWCLTCNRHLENSDQVYCSSECYNEDNPSTTPSSIMDYHDSSLLSQPIPSLGLWPASNHQGILAWARNVPPGLPSDERTPSPRRRTSRPVLLSTGMSSRPLAPALSVASSPVHAQPSHPIQTPRSSERPPTSLYYQSAGGLSTTTSLATESVATPISGEDERITSPAQPPCATSVIGALAKHVRTWVGNPTSRQAPPPKRSLQDPAVAGVDPTPLPLARSRGTSSLYVADEDVLPAKEITAPGDVFSVDWLGRPKPSVNPYHLPAPCDHPAFRARGRKAARAFADC
ncbi:hypothetical protein BGW80DRAFT_68507 [Lactifluus volemus]|nr:hypothetical protein BGW80DRAFT_68507 [Lactifluus volemus]